jgi:hypothetical protein
MIIKQLNMFTEQSIFLDKPNSCSPSQEIHNVVTESEGSQDPVTGPYLEPDESSPLLVILSH